MFNELLFLLQKALRMTLKYPLFAIGLMIWTYCRKRLNLARKSCSSSTGPSKMWMLLYLDYVKRKWNTFAGNMIQIIVTLLLQCITAYCILLKVFGHCCVYFKICCAFQECPSGVVTEDVFKLIYSQFFPQGGETALLQYTLSFLGAQAL